MIPNYIHDSFLEHPYYNDIYVSVFGIILSHKSGTLRELKQSDNGYGYLRVGIGHSNPQYVHRLVAETYIPNYNPEIKIEVNHDDGNTYINYFLNLEWVTSKENSIHSFRTGLNPGSPTRSIRIIETDEIFRSITECARKLNGNQGNISRCLHNERGTHRGFHFEYVNYYTEEGIDYDCY